MSEAIKEQSKTTTTITIPTEYEEEIKRILQNLTLNKDKLYHSTASENKDEDIHEVTQVCNHKIVRGIWYFQVKFKNQASLEWVEDRDSYCEELISAYLETKKLNTTYCFCRVSSLNQVGETHVSLDAQENELIKNTTNTSNRIKVIRLAASAYKDIPKDFFQIGECAHKGDEIITYRVDRFGRNIVKYLSWMEQLANRGIDIISYADKICYSKNKLDFIQKLLEANKESKLLSDRIKMSIKLRRERGDEKIGKLQYGKKYEKSNNKLVVVDDKRSSDVIREIMRSKDSNIRIANSLNSKGLYKYNRKWTANMVRYIKTKYNLEDKE